MPKNSRQVGSPLRSKSDILIRPASGAAPQLCAFGLGDVASLSIINKVNDTKDRALTAFPPVISFNTGWIFIGYHDSFRWVEGPMAAIIERLNASGRKLPSEALDNLRRNLKGYPNEEQTPAVDESSFPRFEDVIRWRHEIEDSSIDKYSSIPALGDVLRVIKSRRIIIANFKISGLKSQMTFPGIIKGTIDSDDETGVVLPEGALVIVRDVQLGAYEGRPAAVWCRVAACEPGIPQCDAALRTAGR
jgi:hypothetical protein